MTPLKDTVAVVTGATRGLGKGIALGLGEAGATVYVTGRSTRRSPGVLPGTVEDTAHEVTQLGGEGIAIPCDHRVDADVEALFTRVRQEQGRLDLLVNNAFASPEQRVLWSAERFWNIPVALWDDIIAVGLRSHFVATRYAAEMMIAQRHGLVVNVASHSAGAGKTARSKSIIPYSVAKAALHRLSADMAVELRDFDVGVVSIWPPASQTEGVRAQAEVFGDISGWAPPRFTGRVVAALVAGGTGLARSGQALVVEDLARELGVPLTTA